MSSNKFSDYNLLLTLFSSFCDKDIFDHVDMSNLGVDEKIILYYCAIQNNINLIEFIPPEHQTINMCIFVLSHDYSKLEFIKNAYFIENIKLYHPVLVRENPHIIETIEQTPELCNLAFSIEPSLIVSIKNPTKEMVLFCAIKSGYRWHLNYINPELITDDILKILCRPNVPHYGFTEDIKNKINTYLGKDSLTNAGNYLLNKFKSDNENTNKIMEIVINKIANKFKDVDNLKSIDIQKELVKEICNDLRDTYDNEDISKTCDNFFNKLNKEDTTQMGLCPLDTTTQMGLNTIIPEPLNDEQLDVETLKKISGNDTTKIQPNNNIVVSDFQETNIQPQQIKQSDEVKTTNKNKEDEKQLLEKFELDLKKTEQIINNNNDDDDMPELEDNEAFDGKKWLSVSKKEDTKNSSIEPLNPKGFNGETSSLVDVGQDFEHIEVENKSSEKELINSILMNDGLKLKDIKNPTQKQCEIAVSQNHLALIYVPENLRTQEIIMLAIKSTK